MNYNLKLLEAFKKYTRSLAIRYIIVNIYANFTPFLTMERLQKQIYVQFDL